MKIEETFTGLVGLNYYHAPEYLVECYQLDWDLEVERPFTRAIPSEQNEGALEKTPCSIALPNRDRYIAFLFDATSAAVNYITTDGAGEKLFEGELRCQRAYQ